MTTPFPRYMFGGITHVITNPTGHAPGWNYSAVGSVPVALPRRAYATADALVAAILAAGGKPCVSDTCACRAHFASVLTTDA